MSSPLASFDPFAVHPFTNNSSAPRNLQQPSQYPAFVTSQSFASAATHSPNSSPPTTPTGTPGAPAMHAPSPRRTTPKDSAAAPRPHVFEPFRHDGRQSPELQDLLSKRHVQQTWGLPAPAAKASGRR